MSRFPFLNVLDSEIVSAITNVDKQKFSGTKAFAFIQCFIQDNSDAKFVIGTETYTQYNIAENINNLTSRIPPILKSIEVKTAGNLGAIKKAEATIQFSDMEQLKKNRGFLFIGKTQLLVWGWAKGRDGKQIGVGGGIEMALTAANAKKRHAYVNGKDFDIFSGILTNFDIKINENLTVDVKVELSSPSDIPAFLALSKQNQAQIDSSDSEKAKATVMAAQAAKLDPKDSTDTYTKLLAYTLNLNDEILDWTYGNTDDPYIQLGYIVKTICNKGKDSKTANGVPLDVRIDDSVASARPVMISASENVIIPAAQLPKTIDTETIQFGKETVKTVTLDKTQPITFGPVNLSSDSVQFPTPTDTTLLGDIVLPANYHGHIKNLFINAKFIKEAARGMSNNKEFLEKIITELNVAGAGLWNLALRDIEGPDGFMQYTIVDYNLTNELNAIPELNLYDSKSTITNIELNADLPKEVAGQAMLGQKGKDENVQVADHPVGDFLFRTSTADPVIGALQVQQAIYAAERAIADANSGTPTEPPAQDLTLGQVAANTWNGIGAIGGALLDVGKGIVNTAVDTLAYVKDKVMAGIKAMLNAPGEMRVKLNSAPYYSGNESSYFVVVKDAGIVKNLYFKDDKQKNVLLPSKITFTTLGVGGFVIGKAVKIPGIPWLDVNKGYWQITDITQKVDDSKWEIDVELRFRVQTK